MRHLLKERNKDWRYEDASSRRLLARLVLAVLRADSPSHECPNLVTAIYLQGFLLITGNKPVRHCDYCGEPFEAKPKHKKTCNGSCRSALSKKRRRS